MLILIFFQIIINFGFQGIDGKLNFDAFKNQWSVHNGKCILQINEPCYINQRIKFYLYTGKEDSPPYELDLKTKKIPKSYNRNQPLKLIIHGYGGNFENQHTALLRNEYQKQGGYNILVVDWSSLAKLPCYPSAAVNTYQVGKCTGLAIATMLPASYIHAIGFSLGAHVASFASNYLNYHSKRKFNRITGLDPALPLFGTPKLSHKLDPSDADFVDVLHTNAGIFGKLEPCGHADFYVNGAIRQPMCTQNKNPPFCSHMMAPQFFAESINSPVGFWGRPCSSYFQYALNICITPSNMASRILMGEFIDLNSRGIFIVNTRLSSPFALG